MHSEGYSWVLPGHRFVGREGAIFNPPDILACGNGNRYLQQAGSSFLSILRENTSMFKICVPRFPQWCEVVGRIVPGRVAGGVFADCGAGPHRAKPWTAARSQSCKATSTPWRGSSLTRAESTRIRKSPGVSRWCSSFPRRNRPTLISCCCNSAIPPRQLPQMVDARAIRGALRHERRRSR